MAYPQEQFVHAHLDPSSLLGRLRSAAGQHTISYQLDVLKKTGRYNAFELKWHPTYAAPATTWPIPDHQFWDSDCAKWIEGACYYLSSSSSSGSSSANDKSIERAVDELVDMIRAAQHPDGYLNIHYSVV